MHLVEPKVFLIAETKVDRVELKSALRELGGETATNWFDRVAGVSKSDGELLTEVGGRMCYKSFGVGLNPNVKKIREDSQDYISNTLAKGDGSIFEHATVTFLFLNVSRVFTHELVRHRAGIAVSQESLRYVRLGDLGLWIPEDLEDKKIKIMRIVETLENSYKELEKEYNWDAMGFGQKKVITSSLRRIAPQGMATNVMWSANHRALRHIINMRTSEGAETEIRFVFDKVAQSVKERFPLTYNDFKPKELADGTRSWTPTYVKA